MPHIIKSSEIVTSSGYDDEGDEIVPVFTPHCTVQKWGQITKEKGIDI